MFLAKVAVQNRIVLIRRRHYVLHAKRAVAKADMSGGNDIAPAPTAFDLYVFVFVH